MPFTLDRHLPEWKIPVELNQERISALNRRRKEKWINQICLRT